MINENDPATGEIILMKYSAMFMSAMMESGKYYYEGELITSAAISLAKALIAELNKDKLANKTTHQVIAQNKTLGDIKFDGIGNILHEEDRVYIFDPVAHTHTRHYGTLYIKSIDTKTKEWYVKYDDGGDCLVIDFALLYKA